MCSNEYLDTMQCLIKIRQAYNENSSNIVTTLLNTLYAYKWERNASVIVNLPFFSILFFLFIFIFHFSRFITDARCARLIKQSGRSLFIHFFLKTNISYKGCIVQPLGTSLQDFTSHRFRKYCKRTRSWTSKAVPTYAKRKGDRTMSAVVDSWTWTLRPRTGKPGRRNLEIRRSTHKTIDFPCRNPTRLVTTRVIDDERKSNNSIVYDNHNDFTIREKHTRTCPRTEYDVNSAIALTMCARVKSC